MDRYAVIGNPIAHSKSPFIHQAFAQQCQQILEYRAECAPLEGFAAFIQNLHQAGLKGANVTVPFKLEAFNLATEHTARALAAGAVNTLKFMESGHILGDNTDGAGLVYDLARLDFKLEGQRILLLGAGGAAQGVIQPLLNCKPASLVIANRTFEKAQALAARFHQTYNNIPVSSAHFETLSPDFHGIINASASSLKADLPPLPTAVYSEAQWAYDMMYSAMPTRFLQTAGHYGVQNLADGLGMLVAQAAESFYLWRSVRPNILPVLADLRAQLHTPPIR